MALRPVPNKITQNFGVKNSAYRLGYHPGTDYGSLVGTPIKATTDGVVRYYSGHNGGYGNVAALVRTNGDVVWHSHLSRPGKTGRVKKGQIIGYTGATGWVTGPHAHIEYRLKGSQDRPINFETWLRQHPEPKPTPKPVKKPSAKQYIVRAGDTLGGIARRFGVSLKLLLQKNTQYKKNPNKIYPGQKVNIPVKSAPKPVYLNVGVGQGLSHLAKRAGYKDWTSANRWQAITSLNKKGWSWQRFNGSLKYGQRVRVK